MSHLIEDSIFLRYSRSPQLQLKQNLNTHPRLISFVKTQDNFALNNQKIASKVYFNDYSTFHNYFAHKIFGFTLVVSKKFISQKKYRFEGIILENDSKFSIKLKQKRILFGKQWIKSKIQSKIKISLSFNTGQIRLFWPQIFESDPLSVLYPQVPPKSVFSKIFTEFIDFFQTLAFYLRKVLNTDSKIDYIQQYFNQQNNDSSDQILFKLQKYLYMSSIVDSLQKDKQSFKGLQHRMSKQKGETIKLQTNIDLTFANIGKQIKIYSYKSPKTEIKKLGQVGILQFEERKQLEELFAVQQSKPMCENQCQYVLNLIGIVKIQNKKRFISSGGKSDIFMTKILFQYIFSNDTKYWIEQNKKTAQNIIEKYFVIKQAKKGQEAKLKHEFQIIRQMKGGYSIFLPKYYKIQNFQLEEARLRTQNNLLMDYYKGETLQNYVLMNKESLSFWTKIFIIRNVLNGLRFISGYKIVHLDLKPNNILVINDLLTKLIDFGQSYHSKICKQNYKPGITLPYSCPQIFYEKNTNFQQKCDVFSLGIIMYELFIKINVFQLPIAKITQLYKSKSYLKRIFLNPEILESQNIMPIFNIIFMLTMRCLDPEPEKRPTLNWISIIIRQILMNFKGK